MVHNIRTKDEFQDTIKTYPVVVVDFYSTHATESKAIAPTFAHANELDRFKEFRFCKVDIEDLKGLAEEVGVSKPATFHMYKNGEKINTLQSAEVEDLMQFLETGL
ncbi:thioredoxin-like protein [Fusarium flagelliforme]|uniref:thioredoxin-like protein n=1 Tax=Fusarium flagelliforme TaxID=2675880 RepID=UPI001E8DF38B|nr:thioredoxin-like protein [Fusarium flagelliforme]KAH7184867.1 thioredoxin-like protein [Fusarium flagelliforme]